MTATLIKVDQGLWINPRYVITIAAVDADDLIDITMTNGHIRIDDPSRYGATATAVADQIAAIINGSGN